MNDVVTTNSNAFISRFHVSPEHKQAFIDTFDALWRGTREFMNEHCNLVFYGWSRDGRIFYAIESWKDEAITAGLRETAEFKATVGQLMDYCDAPMEMELIKGVESAGLFFENYPQGESTVHPKGKNGLGAVFL